MTICPAQTSALPSLLCLCLHPSIHLSAPCLCPSTYLSAPISTCPSATASPPSTTDHLCPSAPASTLPPDPLPPFPPLCPCLCPPFHLYTHPSTCSSFPSSCNERNFILSHFCNFGSGDQLAFCEFSSRRCNLSFLLFIYVIPLPAPVFLPPLPRPCD